MKTNLQHKQHKTFFGRNAILLAITALALLASPGVALADCTPVTNWTDGKSSWFTSGNWDNGVPTSGTGAVVNNGGTAQISASTPVASACSLSLGPDSGHSGNVSVSIGTLQVTTSVVVGNHGTASLSVTNGGTVTGGDMYVGGTAATDGTGLLTVTDTSTVTAASVLVYPNGTLSGYGTVSTTNGTSVEGTLAPKGGGTTLTIGGTLSLASGAKTQCNVTPQDPSTTEQVHVSGQVSLGGTLSVTMAGDFGSAPTRFTLLYADSVNSSHPTFDSTSITYPTGHCWHPVITYDSTNHFHVYLDRVIDCN